MLEAYRKHVAERAALNIPPKPLNAEQVAELVELLKNPPAGEEELSSGAHQQPRTSRCRRSRLRQGRFFIGPHGR